MAFTVTSKDPTRVKIVGIDQRPRQYVGVSTLSGGVKTITIPNIQRVIFVIPSSHTANACRWSASSGNTFEVTGTSADTFGWLAIVEP